MKRKLRRLGNSLVITLPKQICNLYNFEEGDFFEFKEMKNNHIVLKRVENERKRRENTY